MGKDSKAKLIPTVRIASRADLPAILRLYAQPELDAGSALPLEQAGALFDRMATYPDYRLYVADVGGEVAGTFALLVMDNLSHLGSPSGVVEAVAVVPSHRREGVGRAMMAHALEVCRQRRCYKLTLSSNIKRQAAHAFYEKLGFERHGYSFLVTLR